MGKNPNIILILADDLGIGDVSCFNPNSKIRTKNLDSLAEEGLRCTDCHASSALCTPSRYSLLTGRYNWRSRLKAGVLPGVSFPLIEEGRETLGTMLQKQGYRTACVGKWHLGMSWTVKEDYRLPPTYGHPSCEAERTMNGIDYTAPISDGPNTRGFDYFYGMPASLDQPPFVRIENDRVLTPPDRMIGIKALDRVGPTTPTDVEYGPAAPDFDPAGVVPEMDEKVLALVEEYAKQTQPFFIYYPTLAVHGPLVPSEEYRGRSGIGLYGDFVLQLDGFVGRLMDKLKEKDIVENTIVIFTSDNGCSGIADYPALHALGHDPSCSYRGKKSDIWEGGHRIPFIVRWPGHTPEGGSCPQLTCLSDLFATLADITGHHYGDGAGEDSVSARSLWEGADEPVRDTIMHHSHCNYSIRKNNWKLEFCPGSGGMRKREEMGTPEHNPEGTPYQLYDLNEDIGEQHNLYGRRPEVEAELTAQAREIVSRGRSTPGRMQENHPAPNWPGLDWMN